MTVHSSSFYPVDITGNSSPIKHIHEENKKNKNEDKTKISIQHIFHSSMCFLEKSFGFISKSIITIVSAIGVTIGGLLSAPFALIQIVLKWLIKRNAIKHLIIGKRHPLSRKEMEEKFDELIKKKAQIDNLEIINKSNPTYTLPDNFKDLITTIKAQSISLEGYTLDADLKAFLEDELEMDVFIDNTKKTVEISSMEDVNKEIRFKTSQDLINELNKVKKTAKKINILKLIYEGKNNYTLNDTDVKTIAKYLPKRIYCRNITSTALFKNCNHLQKIKFAFSRGSDSV